MICGELGIWGFVMLCKGYLQAAHPIKCQVSGLMPLLEGWTYGPTTWALRPFRGGLGALRYIQGIW